MIKIVHSQKECNNITSRMSCRNKNCYKHVTFHSYKYGYSEYCSSKCGVNDNEVKFKIQNTCIKKYGVKTPFQSKTIQEKIRNTNLNKYGVENVFQTDEVKEKIKKTNIDRIGCEYPMQSDDVKNKSKNTLLKKYGVDHNSKIKSIIEKRKKTSLNKYGTENPSQSDIIKNRTRETNLKKYGVEYTNQIHISKKSLELLHNKKWLQNQHHGLKHSCTEIAKILNVYYGTVISYLNKHEIELKNYFSSSPEKEIIDFIDNINIQNNTRSIVPPYELDIYIPDYKLAIEYNGLYWHGKHDRNYHLNKTKRCAENGIQLLHIFENEWIDPIKQDIWKSIINGKLGRNNRIFARKTEVKEITDNKLVRQFIDNNHLQGHVGSSIKIGLFYEDELVSLMTFGKTRFSKKYEWEMIRFCNKKFISVIGGASKLYKYFSRNYKPKSVISYANRRYSNGNLYNKLGFKFSHFSKPNYWYFKNNQKLYNRIMFQKHKLKNLLEYYDSNKSEIENMLENKYLRIFDCGNIIFYS